MSTQGDIETDVLVVGGGPGGSAAAYHLARHGIDVTVLERATFPREKVCGDGITPRGVAAMLKMGVDPDDPGFERVNGLRVHSRSATIDLPWPELSSWPGYGLVRTREDFDALLMQRAQKAGARLLERTEAVAPLIQRGWVQGSTIRPARSSNGAEPRTTDDRDGEQTRIRARFVIAADGAASRFAKPAGVRLDTSKPLGIAARRYYRTSYHPGPWFESWLDLWEGDLLLPGYGWLFPVAGGRINLGAGLLNTFKDFKQVSAQRLFDAFASMLPTGWGISEDSADGRVLSGPLPMSINRTPQAVPGLLLVGDAAGIVNPFNGEGIGYAMESAEMAAELVHEALVKDRPGIAMMYPTLLNERYGDYFKIGRGFAKVIGKPRIMGLATRYLLPHPGVMAFAMRVMANLTDGRDGDAQDRLMYLLERLARAA
ncbi:MAG: geranylgeranyl reductase family protein [Actinomycetota bacterium]|nr:geranylgeranyl reductase family protein [Actinomycetota bacterium]